MRPLTLILLPDSFAICRLEPDAPLPQGILARGFAAAIRTGEELCVYCAEDAVPAGAQASRGWRGLEFLGPFSFGETGVIASVARPLAEAGISISVLATYDTDYLFIQQDALDNALEVLAAAGHRIVGHD
jgi:hypothetical protein